MLGATVPRYNKIMESEKEPVTSTEDTIPEVIKADAVEFGRHVRAGGYRLGLLVARNVQPGRGQGRRTPNVVLIKTTLEKVSAAEFARESGTTAGRVMRFFEAWERAAADKPHTLGKVLPANELNPGDEPDLNVETLPPWEKYYTSRPRVKGAPAQTDLPKSEIPTPASIIRNDYYQRAAEERGRRAQEPEREPRHFDVGEEVPDSPEYVANNYWYDLRRQMASAREVLRVSIRLTEKHPEALSELVSDHRRAWIADEAERIVALASGLRILARGMGDLDDQLRTLVDNEEEGEVE